MTTEQAGKHLWGRKRELDRRYTSEFPRWTVTDSVALSILLTDWTNLKFQPCEFCGYRFDAGCGRHGCPNCHGEGLAAEGSRR